MKYTLKNSLLVFLLTGSLFNCTSESVKSELEDQALTFIEFSIPSVYQYEDSDLATSKGNFGLEEEVIKLKAIDENGKEIIGYARFTMPDNADEKLIKAELTSNIVEGLNLTNDFWEKALASNKDVEYGKSSCIASCHSTYTDANGDKIKGRGWCKAQCWAAAVASAAAAVIIAIL